MLNEIRVPCPIFNPLMCVCVCGSLNKFIVHHFSSIFHSLLCFCKNFNGFCIENWNHFVEISFLLFWSIFIFCAEISFIQTTKDYSSIRFTFQWNFSMFLSTSSFSSLIIIRKADRWALDGEGTRLVERTAQKWQKLLFQINLVAQSLCSLCGFNSRCHFSAAFDEKLPRHFIESSSKESRVELATKRVAKKANDLNLIQICWFVASPFRSLSWHQELVVSVTMQSNPIQYNHESDKHRQCRLSWEMWKNVSNGFMSEKHFSRIPYHPSTILSRQKISRFQSFLLFHSFFVKIYKKRDWEVLITILTYSFVISTCCWCFYCVSGSTQCCLISLHAFNNLHSKVIRNVQAMFFISLSSTVPTNNDNKHSRLKLEEEMFINKPLAHNTKTRLEKYHRRRKNSLRLKAKITKEISFLCVDFHALSVER